MGLTLCIGAGPAGLTAAYQLAKAGQHVLVLEADPEYVGGISRTIQRDGFCFDIGGHRFFSKSDEVEALWKEILGSDLLTRPRKSRIFYNHRFFPYPLDIIKTFTNLGMMESAHCCLSYVHARLRPIRPVATYEEWVVNQFGRRLFEIFFKTYTEKVWGTKCSEISADWAAQRIKGLSLSSAVKNAAMGMLGINKNAGIKTLIEQFSYPRKGPGMMWERAAQKITAGGGNVKLGCRVESLAYDGSAWQVGYYNAMAGKTEIVVADSIICSMPLRHLIQAMDNVPQPVRDAAEQLKYRDFLIVALVLNDKNQFSDNWLYIHSPDVKVGRIQNFKAWSPEMVPDPALACYGMEYFCFEGDGLWSSSDAELIALASQELENIGLAKASEIQRGFVIRQPKAYPVYDAHYQRHIEVIRTWLEASCPNLQVAGRNGMHKYNNQDHSMMTAMLAVKNILAGGKPYDVWCVNQDAEYHEADTGSSGERQVPLYAAQ